MLRINFEKKMKLLRFTDPANINKFYIYKNNFFVQKKKKKKNFMNIFKFFLVGICFKMN